MAYKEHGVDGVVGEQVGERMHRGLHMSGIGSAHERIVERRDTADGALLRQVAEAVEGKHDMPVVLETGAIRLPDEMPTHYAAILFYRGHW